MTERVTTVGQSFFDPLPAGADLYLLKIVLNDWPDREASADPAPLRRGGAPERSSRRPRRGVAGRGNARPLARRWCWWAARTDALRVPSARPRGWAGGSQAAGRQPSGRFVVECPPSVVGRRSSATCDRASYVATAQARASGEDRGRDAHLLRKLIRSRRLGTTRFADPRVWGAPWCLGSRHPVRTGPKARLERRRRFLKVFRETQPRTSTE